MTILVHMFKKTNYLRQCLASCYYSVLHTNALPGISSNFYSAHVTQFQKWQANKHFVRGSKSDSRSVGSGIQLLEKRKQESIDSLGSWDTTTDLPLAVEESIASGKPIPSISAPSIGVSSMKGRRTYNEDQYSFQQLNESLLYFGIFDGHGGKACAKFCANMFPKHVSS